MLNTVKKQEGDTLVVALDGRLDTNTAPGFLSEMEPMLDSVNALTLDCEKLEYLSSAGLRVLFTLEEEMKQYKQQDEDVLSYALFPQVATDFFKYREAQQTKVDASIADTKNGAYPV